MEAGLLIGVDGGWINQGGGSVIYRHAPKDRTVASLPDSRSLWDAIWENRHGVLGFAHSHPGTGRPSPSPTDLTTFAAVEAALGKRLLWWIASEDRWVCVYWTENSSSGSYISVDTDVEPRWLPELRAMSCYVECSFPGCCEPYVSRGRCEVHKNEPDDCACRAGAPFHTDDRCPGFRE
jgi:hypothetical protein